jgi:hypothetical protein
VLYEIKFPRSRVECESLWSSVSSIIDCLNNLMQGSRFSLDHHHTYIYIYIYFIII